MRYAIKPMNASTHRILIAEDNEALRRQFEHVLHDEGYDVSCVDSGEDAIDLLTSRHFDLVVTDIEMRGVMSGVRVAGRRLIAYPKTKVIVVTGMTGLSNSAVGRDGFPGAVETLFKPIDAQELVAAVKRVLAQ